MNGADRCAAMQIGIELVQRVAIPVVDDRVDLVAVVLTYARGPAAVGAVLVDVVAGVEDEVESLVGEMAVPGEVAVFVVTAAADAEAELIDGRAFRRRGLRAARPG